MSAQKNLQLAIERLGLIDAMRLIAEKYLKHRRLLALLKQTPGALTLRTRSESIPLTIDDKEKEEILLKADAMLADKNYFFTFAYKIAEIDDPWNYDPLEGKYWQKKHYEETTVHTIDSPRDVKIVWEINRFKDLPVLAQAAYITKEKKYVSEVESRILSWIESNPFGATINWSSPLELAIRSISWTASLSLLRAAGFMVHDNAVIKKALWQHAAYIHSQLSTDKIVQSNHVIGELCGLYALSSLYDFPEAKKYGISAKDLFINAVLDQTYTDGASKESSGWYHTFVVDFVDLFIRVAKQNNDELQKEFIDRFEKMIIYRNSITATDYSVVKFGDFDNGKAIDLSPKWRDLVFGEQPIRTGHTEQVFNTAQHITARIGNQYLFVRCGEFGWGGDGFSSHAHDDFLSPSFNFDRKTFLVDPGTFVYNGNPSKRDEYRTASAHNGVIIGKAGAVLKPSFGWKKVRPNATINSFVSTDESIDAVCSYGEWKDQHLRHFQMTADMLVIVDIFTLKSEEPVEWNFHFHPRWRIELLSPQKAILRDFRDFHFIVELSQGNAEFEMLGYDFSPSYMVKSPGQKIRIRKNITTQEQTFRFEITRAS